MMRTPSGKQSNHPQCLVHSVAVALADEPALEAVTIEDSSESVFVATLGKVTDPTLEKRVAEMVRKVREASGSNECGLLQGKPNCDGCATPVDPIERGTITIQRKADQTTIARVTCPTAPTFWHWRKISWPKLGPRELEILRTSTRSTNGNGNSLPPSFAAFSDWLRCPPAKTVWGWRSSRFPTSRVPGSPQWKFSSYCRNKNWMCIF